MATVLRPLLKLRTVTTLFSPRWQWFHRQTLAQGALNRPPSSCELPIPSGMNTMMLLPLQDQDTTGLDACFVGVALDQGTCNRSGTRFGPRQIRAESGLLREYNMATGAAPFQSLQVADVGNVRLCSYDLPKATRDIKEAFAKLISNGCKTLTLGGDHTLTYPILQAVKERYGPVGLIHVDAHDDTADTMEGCKIAHGTPFKRAGDEGCLDFNRVVQIGLRGQGYGPDEYEYGEKNGFRIVRAEDCWHKSLTPLMAEVRQQMRDHPVYLTFDIDALDPGFAPGTGTPEVGGLTTIQGLEIIRGCRGLNIVGCDLVEVSPPYDSSGNTALIAANYLYEMLCILPGVQYRK